MSVLLPLLAAATALAGTPSPGAPRAVALARVSVEIIRVERVVPQGGPEGVERAVRRNGREITIDFL